MRFAEEHDASCRVVRDVAAGGGIAPHGEVAPQRKVAA
jgi:hypothetical protein